jgi:hypothetical protein
VPDHRHAVGLPTGRKYGPASWKGGASIESFEWMEEYNLLSDQATRDLSAEAEAINARNQVSCGCCGR